MTVTNQDINTRLNLNSVFSGMPLKLSLFCYWQQMKSDILVIVAKIRFVAYFFRWKTKECSWKETKQKQKLNVWILNGRTTSKMPEYIARNSKDEKRQLRSEFTCFLKRNSSIFYASIITRCCLKIWTRINIKSLIFIFPQAKFIENNW